jgi:NitT/TauT family transport system substrate-binding protein
VHFAQINQRDGFLLAGRLPETAFEWRGLEGKTLLADHAWQPLAMLRYAMHCQGIDVERVEIVDRGSPAEIDAAFRAGLGDYVHLQGPAAQQLEKEGIGHVVASVGAAMPPVAFSSLMASRDFLAGETARPFVRAYRAARAWVREAAAAEVAERQAGFFPGVAREALESAVARYQALGCWDGEIGIARDLYDQALAVFRHSGAVEHPHPFKDVVVSPPEG